MKTLDNQVEICVSYFDMIVYKWQSWTLYNERKKFYMQLLLLLSLDNILQVRNMISKKGCVV